MFQVVYPENLSSTLVESRGSWLCLQNDMQDHIGPSNSVVSSVAGGECILEMCQQLQLKLLFEDLGFPYSQKERQL